MAKKNTPSLRQAIAEGEIDNSFDLDAILLTDTPLEKKSDFVEEQLIKGYKERGWDDNRIAARLMVSLDKVKQVN